jgi:hypothetical protein
MLKMKGNMLTTKEGMLMAKTMGNEKLMIKDWGCNGEKNSNDERQQGVLKVMVGVLGC